MKTYYKIRIMTSKGKLKPVLEAVPWTYPRDKFDRDYESYGEAYKDLEEHLSDEKTYDLNNYVIKKYFRKE